MIDTTCEEERAMSELAWLPELSPGALGAARIRTRCHEQLARRAHGSDPAPRPRDGVLAPVIVLGVCGIYVYSLISTAWRLTGLL